MAKTYCKVEEHCDEKGINGTARAIAKTLYGHHAPIVNKAIRNGTEYGPLKINNKALAKVVGGVPSTMYRNRKKLVDARVIISQQSYGPSKNFEVHLNPDLYVISTTRDPNTCLDIKAILKMPLRAKCTPVPVSSNLNLNINKREPECKVNAECNIECKNEGHRPESTVQNGNKNESFKMATSQRQPPGNSEVLPDELKRFSNQCVLTIIDRLFKGNVYSKHQEKWLRGFVYQFFQKSDDPKTEFANILAGTSEAARRNLTRDLRISEFLKNGGLNKLAAMGNLPGTPSSSTNPSGAVATLAAKMQIN